jgi:heat shock protein HtpX
MKKTQTVYDHIRSNNINTLLLVALFPVIFIALIFLFVRIVAPLNQAIETTISVAIPTFIVCMIWMTISWTFGDSMILNAAGAAEIKPDTPENREIFRMVENVALAAGLPTPRVYIINDNSLNAFATGRTPRDASVALTRGIINKLDKNELAGVIAHEMAHIGNRDIRLDMLIITGIGVTVFIADMMSRTAIYENHHRTSNNNNRDNIAAILMMIWVAFTVFNFIITPLLRMAVSRNREYAADATGALITRDPKSLASALKKISSNSQIKSMDNVKSMAAIYIAAPSKPSQFVSDLFATHPPIKNRIKKLNSMS